MASLIVRLLGTGEEYYKLFAVASFFQKFLLMLYL